MAANGRRAGPAQALAAAAAAELDAALRARLLRPTQARKTDPNLNLQFLLYPNPILPYRRRRPARGAGAGAGGGGGGGAGRGAARAAAAPDAGREDGDEHHAQPGTRHAPGGRRRRRGAPRKAAVVVITPMRLL